MIIDAHYHLEDRVETLDELLAQMTQHGIDRVALIPTLVDPVHYLPERHQRLKIIYAHAGLPFYREVWEYGRRKDNVCIDLSNPFFVDEQVRVNAIKTMESEKCVHGTDGPYAHASQGRMLDYVLRLPLSDLEKERILGSNFTNLIS
jgi:predicted TIM-barrel fold metal-dependent hydrolase